MEMLLTDYDEAYTMELFKKEGYEEGYEEGFEIGRREGILKVLNLLESHGQISKETAEIEFQKMMNKHETPMYSKKVVATDDV